MKKIAVCILIYCCSVCHVYGHSQSNNELPKIHSDSTEVLLTSEEARGTELTQVRRPPSISFHLGVHSASTDYYQYDDAEMLGGYHAGVSFTIPTIHPQLSIESSVFYVPKGYRSEAPITITNQGIPVGIGRSEVQLKFHFIEFPVSLLYDINPQSTGVFRFRLGGSLGLNVDAVWTRVIEFQGEELQRLTYDKDYVKQFSNQEDVIYSLTTGIEYEIYNIRAMVHYMVGGGNVGHRMFGFTLGYRI